MSTQGSSRITESDRGPNRGEAYGIAGLSQLLEGVSFPVSKDELIRRYGQKSFQWTKGGQTYTLAECMQKVNRQEFNSITEITAAVSDQVGQGARQ